MKILVVGGGGREHALIRKLKENPRVTEIYALPGNGGIGADAVCVPIGATDIQGITAFAKENAVDFAVVAPDDPLVLGTVDALHAEGIRCFGPEKNAARIEGSKAYAKELMRKHSIPTADYAVFDEANAALEALATAKFPVVVKADGLALGKGVVIAGNKASAEEGILSMMRDKAFGESGARVVIEEYLEGPEVTVLAFTDGETIVPMVSSMDHKRARDGDEGPNTGGMGVIAPNPFYTREIEARCMREIFLPTIRALNAEGNPFRGCLYFGLMLTADGPKVIEYNCRFGDPEAQAVLSLLQSDLLTIMEAVEAGRLGEVDVSFAPGASCCIMVVSGGYPEGYRKGCAITVGPMPEDVSVLHSGTALGEDGLVTAGGRVLGIVATADSLPAAIKKAYAGAEQVHFDGAYYRRDIGKSALEAM